MLLLTDLPPEIIHHILGYVDPQDLARVPRACKRLYHAVSANTTLFKHLYLNHLDAPSDDAFNWEQALKDFVRLRALCSRDHVDDKKDELDFVYRTVIELLKSAATDGERPGLAAKLPQSRNADILSEIFSSESNRSAFLCRSFIYERARAGFHSKEIGYWHGPPGSEHQKGAHLHCLYGVPRLFAYPSMRPPTRKHSMRPYASSKVYDLRQYTQENKWGPFLDDGTMNVDWEKVEAIMIVLGANIDDLGLSRKKLCEAFCSVPFAGTWPNSWKSPPIPSTPRELDPVEHLDPYGITGVWLRVVCFLDYSDFFAFNFGNVELPRYISRPSISARQATRIIRMHIIVTDIEDPGPEDGQDLPVVNFKGISTAIDQSVDENANSDLRGSVRLTPEGEVRWTTFSIYGGEERWRSESIQVGGVRSAKGVLGHWFDKDFDPRGPAGPTAFWKISDQYQPGANAGPDEYDLLAEGSELDGDYESSEGGDGEGYSDGEDGVPAGVSVPAA